MHLLVRPVVARIELHQGLEVQFWTTRVAAGNVVPISPARGLGRVLRVDRVAPVPLRGVAVDGGIVDRTWIVLRDRIDLADSTDEVGVADRGARTIVVAEGLHHAAKAIL